jgi:hypothetical protein
MDGFALKDGMKHAILIPAFALMAACATTPVYGPAKSASSEGYLSQQIEQGRHRVSYTDRDPVRARNLALLRAAEITLTEGKDWFEITNESVDSEGGGRSGGPSISVGGSAGSGGYSGVGVGIGIGFPLGGGSSTQTLEIVTGAGAKPDKPEAYDARSVDINLRASAS